jgi:hypothetical protein
MNETNSSWLTASGIIDGYSGTTITTAGNVSLGCTNPSSILTVSNSNNMNKQVKVAVFTVERNEDNRVISSKLVKELWVEQKNGSSIELAVAKQLDKDFDPEITVIKEIYSLTF